MSSWSEKYYKTTIQTAWWILNKTKPFIKLCSLSLSLSETHAFTVIWATSWQNQQCGCAPSGDQPGHPPRVFAVRMKKGWILSYPLNAQRRLWSDWADAQTDLSLRWAHSHFVGFVMRWLIFVNLTGKYQIKWRPTIGVVCGKLSDKLGLF